MSAPFEFYFNEEEEYGGAVYVYYSRYLHKEKSCHGLAELFSHSTGLLIHHYFRGKRQARGDNHLVFHDPIVLRGSEAHSQFGMSLTKLGNIDNDPHNYEGILSDIPILIFLPIFRFCDWCSICG